MRCKDTLNCFCLSSRARAPPSRSSCVRNGGKPLAMCPPQPPVAVASSVSEHMLVGASIQSEPVRRRGRDSEQIFLVGVQAANYVCKKEIHKHADGNCSKYDLLHINIKILPTLQGLSHMHHISRNSLWFSSRPHSTYELFFLEISWNELLRDKLCCQT